jgi:hypothetical protein
LVGNIVLSINTSGGKKSSPESGVWIARNMVFLAKVVMVVVELEVSILVVVDVVVVVVVAVAFLE